MTWREIYGAQNLEMANMMLKQQGDLNDAQARVKSLEARLAGVRRVVGMHDECDTTCDLVLDLQEVLGDE